MERKIGEIFEYNGEWYQCISSSDCPKCDLKHIECCRFKFTCESLHRNDCEEVIFKKLERVGEPYFNGQYGEVLQEYKYYIPPITPDLRIHIIKLGIVGIEIKQNKEDMVNKKTNFVEEIDALCKRYNMAEGVRADFMAEVKEIIKDENRECKLKPFDLEAAKAGKPVCTRNGRKARIICFDKRGEQPIVALIENAEESIDLFFNNGHSVSKTNEVPGDLMMLPEKKEGWVNLYKSSVRSTKEEAMKYRNKCNDYIDTIKIEWEE